MTSNNIKIQTITWDIETDSMQKAVQWQETVSAFCREKMPALIEKAFSAYADDDELMVIDKIELDLSMLRSEEEMEEKLQKTLREYSASPLMISRGRMTGKEGQKLNTPASLLQQFEYYLQNGSLEWNTDAAQFDNPEVILRAIDKLPVDGLRIWLIKILSQKNAAIRFADFFTKGQSLAVLKKVTSKPDILSDVFEFIELLQKITGLNVPYLISISSLYQSVVLRSLQGLKELASAWWHDADKAGYISAAAKEKTLELAVASKQKMKDKNGDKIVNEKTKNIIENNIRDKFHPLLIQISEEGLGRSDTAESLLLTETDSHKRKEVDGSEAEKKFFVDNAGILLLYPYLKKIFKGKGFLTNDYQFISYKESLAACYWLQFIATGNPDIKEYQLPLNKILCGFSIDAPISREWDPVKADKPEAEDFLKEVISNWEKIGNTSLDGFRNSFLLRAGRLTEEDTNWLLYVERKGWDVLLDTLPYPLGIVKLPWMIKPLYVQW